MIYTVTLNPALDKTVEIPNFTLGNVNRITALRTDPGGKGINVSKVIDKLGGSSMALGVLGGNTGRAIADKLNQMGLNCDFLFAQGETRTNLKVVDPINHTNTDINEPGFDITGELLDTLLQNLTQKVKPGDIVVLSGSLPKGAPANTYHKWISRCKESGAKVFLDADGAPLAEGLKAKPFLVKPNTDELSRLVGRELPNKEDMIAAAKALLAEGIEKVVISMGAEGALYITREETILAEGLKVSVGSTVGAGDSVVAALAVAEDRGLPLKEAVVLSTASFRGSPRSDAVVLSTATGAANVMCSGTQAAERSVIDSLMPKVIYHKL
jgi:1-phosphofructokinase